MRKGKTAPNVDEGRKRNRKAAGDSKSLVTYFKQRKSTAQDVKCLNLEGQNQQQLTESGNQEDDKREKGFFACYLLTSLSPRHKGHTYIGFTVNPRRRIRQHNGEIGSGAWRTKSRRPWDMVVCIYGFPTNVSALQFEWAWQHPQRSVAMRQAAATFKSFSGVANKLKLAYTMLNLPAWQSLNITVNYFSTKYTKHSACCPSLPKQMKVQVRSMDELPCYMEQDECECKDDSDNSDEYDEVNDTCETDWETYPDEVVTVSLDNSHNMVHVASHEQFEHIEEYETRKPRKSSAVGVHQIESQISVDSPTSKGTSIATCLPMVEAAESADMGISRRESLRGKQITNPVEADEDPQPSVREKLSTTYDEYEKLGDSSTFEVYQTQPSDVICSPVQTSSSFLTSLSDGETSEVAVMENQLRGSSVAHEVEVIDLLTPSPNSKARSYGKKRRISMFAPEVIDLT
ncbi:hypothetical protein DITRI_Ditri05aG0002800 [Diplodiscus trichospermus]